MPALTRRGAVLGLAGLLSAGPNALALAAAPTERRFVVVNLRGALDGLAAVAPYGDPALAGLRRELMAPPIGEPDGLLDLGGFFGLHPALPNLHALYAAGEMAIVHAVAGPYRARSHFVAQDCLESGTDHRMSSGWLGRAVAAMPDRRGRGDALAVGVALPLLLRGSNAVDNWAPRGFASPPAHLYQTIAELNAADRVTGPAVAEGLRGRGFTAAILAGSEEPKDRFSFPALATAAGEMLRAEDGPRIAALELGGWDTHAQQVNRLAGPLRQLDTGMAALKAALGSVWKQSCVLVMTEFGRTARANGTRGTDHGTATVAFILGGAAEGGVVRGQWPGLGPDALLENRDLMPTGDLRSVAKGLLSAHLRLPIASLDAVFPNSRDVEPMRRLIRT